MCVDRVSHTVDITYLTRKSLCEIRYRDGYREVRLSWLTNPVSSNLEAGAGPLFRADAGLTALKRLYKGAAGRRWPLSPCWHCTGMNNQTARRPFPSGNGDERAPAAPVLFPAFSVYDLSEITSPSL